MRAVGTVVVNCLLKPPHRASCHASGIAVDLNEIAKGLTRMKSFHCGHCRLLVFFENFQCVKCGHLLAYLPNSGDISSLEPLGDNLWGSVGEGSKGQRYRLCGNRIAYNVCNWAVSAEDPNPLCLSCRLTRVIPDITQQANKDGWFKLEVAKRRLVYSLLSLRLPLRDKIQDPKNGLTFEFKADEPNNRILTGHDGGVITVNVAEADDAEREKRRVSNKEPYRTSLGHFRHEIGHYYWDRLIVGSARLEGFRKLFGDEQIDYQQALAEYYKNGPRGNWQEAHISAYSTAHPWEDWAETWAHYLHMVDALETASETGLMLKPKTDDEPAIGPDSVWTQISGNVFNAMANKWHALTYVLNNFNRGLGLADSYPFVLSAPVIEKLRFIHETIVASLDERSHVYRATYSVTESSAP